MRRAWLCAWAPACWSARRATCRCAPCAKVLKPLTPGYEAAADAAGLALCLGTSLLVRPACNLPLRTVQKGAYYPKPSLCGCG